MRQLIVTRPAQKQLGHIDHRTLKNRGAAQVETFQHELTMDLSNIMDHP